VTCAEKDSIIRQEPRIVPIHAKEIDAIWHDAAPLIRLAQRRVESKIGMADIYDDLIAGHMMLWAVRIEDKLVATILTEVVRHPRRTAWRIVMIGGKRMSEWLQNGVETMRRAAQVAGCSHVEADGRLGWVRHAPKCGFVEVSRTYEMEI
jgi:hypothetical protein